MESQQIAHYRILGKLGAGGMGEVWRARDTRLNRDVALKVLPADFANDAERLRRFEQEARATSALNHPNILTVHDFGTHDGAPYLVAELLEGEELRAHLNQGPLPVRRALEYAQQIAAGLAAAHEKGIVHRDLKPENLFVTPDGRVKILDFGLAKLTPPKLSGSVNSEVETMKPLTNPGVVLGTLGYMAPEQVRGQEADARADIFSFGLILYEMLSGRRAFTGTSVADVLSALLKDEPPELSETNAKVTPPLEKLVRHCLAKQPERRFQSARDLGFALETLAMPSGLRLETTAVLPITNTVFAQPPARWFMNARLAWLAAAFFLLALLATVPLATKYVRQSLPTEALAMRFIITSPEKATTVGRPLISPDGRHLIFIANVEGKQQVWVRPLNGFTAQPIAGTEGVQATPFWSPDSRAIAFSVEGKLKRIEISGGTPQLICDFSSPRTGTWGKSGTIVFYAGHTIDQISATGGEPKPVITFGGSRPTNVTIRPCFLPDGHHFLHYGGVTQEMGIYLASVDSKNSQFLVAADSDGIYAPSPTQPDKGWLLFLRSGALMAQPFDASLFTLTGDPIPIADQVEPGTFSVSNTGILVYRARNSYENVQLGWLERTGKPLNVIGTVGFALSPRLSPDGKRVAVMRMDNKTGSADINVIDLARNVESRLTSDPADDAYPLWSPDSSRVVWHSTRAQTYHLYQKLATGVGPEEPLLQSDTRLNPSSWSADGKFLFYSRYDSKTKNDVWVLALEEGRKTFPFLQTEFAESGAQISPDGRWVAYTSDESGTSEIYVQSFPASGNKWPVSMGGGLLSQWRHDGKELFYLSGDRKRLMAVEVKTGATFEAGLPKVLFELGAAQVQRDTYTVSADGQRFLFPRQLREDGPTPFSVVVNWMAEVKR